MQDLDRAGGVYAVMKELTKKGLLDTSVLTCTGKTLAENLEGVVNRNGTCAAGVADINHICDDGFDATDWAAAMAVDVPQANRVSLRSIGSCISGNASMDMGIGPVNEDPNPVFQVTVYATNATATANAAVDTIFRP